MWYASFIQRCQSVSPTKSFNSWKILKTSYCLLLLYRTFCAHFGNFLKTSISVYLQIHWICEQFNVWISALCFLILVTQLTASLKCVLIRPGAMLFTLMPLSASCGAKARTRPCKAVLLVAYTAVGCMGGTYTKPNRTGLYRIVITRVATHILRWVHGTWPRMKDLLWWVCHIYKIQCFVKL